MKIKFVPQSLRMSAAGAEGGAGAGGAGAGGQQPGAPQTPATPPITPAAPNGDNAPVTRAELNAFADALVAKLKAEGPKVEQPDAPKGGDDMTTQLLRELSSKVDGLTAQQKAQQLAGRKQQLVSAALDGVPDVNRGLASLALEGLLASTGVNLDAEGVDVNALAKQLGTTLRTQYASLFTAPGSPKCRRG